jgi:hypothetical protein
LNQEEARELLRAIDPAAARELVVRVAGELDALASQVWAFGMSRGSRRALAMVAQMGSELAVGAALLFEANRWYAGAALVRQLIEVEYLLFLFATDAAEAGKWLKASSEEARKVFTPREMRKRSNGRFQADEYSTHCDLGGHPRPRGHRLLRDPATVPGIEPSGLENPAVGWVDLAQHLERLWGHYVEAVVVHSPTNVYPERFEAIRGLFVAWRERDPAPVRL